jgi:ABC-type glycerol-3-phosphate transport system substrate-binding protein
MPEIFSNRKFQIISGITIILILGIILFAIFGNKKPPPVAANVPITLNWWTVQNPDYYQDAINEFRSFPGNQNVTINLVPVEYNRGEDYYRKLIMEFARNNAPDIFSLKNDDFPAWREFLTPIKNIYNSSNSLLLANYRTEFVDLVVKDTVFRDQIYGITPFVDNLQLYYNKDILGQVGIPLPPKTWQEVESHIQLINRKGSDSKNAFLRSGISLGTGLTAANGDIIRDANVQNFYDIIPAMILQNGGQIYDFQNDNSTFGSGRNTTDLNSGKITANNFDSSKDADPSLIALRYYLSFANITSSRYSWSVDSPNNYQNFLEGKLAYLIDYSGFNKTIKAGNNRLNYGVAELPQLDTKIKKTYGYFFAEAINKNLETKAVENPNNAVAVTKLQKAREFLFYLSTPSTQEKFVSKAGLPSSRKDLINKQLNGDEYVRLFSLGALYADNYYKPDVAATERMWGKLIYRVQFENKPLQESLNQAINEYNLMVQKGAKIRI